MMGFLSIGRLGNHAKPFGLGVIGLAASFLATASDATDFRPSFDQTLAFGNVAVLADDDLRQFSSIEQRAFSRTELNFDKRTNTGALLSIGAAIEATTYTSFDIDEFTLLEATGKYQTDLDADKKWQLRLRLDQAISGTNDDWGFRRTRIGARLQYKHNPTSQTRVRLRFGHRNQNDMLFDGFDQDEYLAEITHEWRPNKDRLMFSGTVYGDLRRAEKDQYSYDEIGVRLKARKPITDQTELSVTLAAFTRTFEGSFSSSNLMVRDDTRVQLNVQLDHNFADNIKGFASVGWDENNSTIFDRDYSGPTFGVGLKVSWD